MTIRPFQLGDLLLHQRLRRYATQLNIEHALLQPESSFRTALKTLLPWHEQRYFAYVLRQHMNGLAQAGIIQFRRRPGRPEADIILLTPSLDVPNGHPAIWQKLLAHAPQDLVQHHIVRVYADLPEQPLLIDTFNRAGFTLYTRETIWRLSSVPTTIDTELSSPAIFPQRTIDEWGLQRLYARITPPLIQQAEGYLAEGTDLLPPILAWPYSGQVNSFVLVVDEIVEGCVQIVRGHNSYWLNLWADTQQGEVEHLHLLLRYGIREYSRYSYRQPLYIAVRDYHGGLSSLLSGYGFVPFTDRACMVRTILQWVKEPALQRIPALEVVRDVVPKPLAIPKSATNGTRPGTITACTDEK